MKSWNEKSVYIIEKLIQYHQYTYKYVVILDLVIPFNDT